jgi:hypothetical protein
MPHEILAGMRLAPESGIAIGDDRRRRFDRVSIARAGILRYLAQRPKASDSVLGIHRWWLSEPGLAELDVLAAVEPLVREGQLEVRSLPDGSRVYAAHQRP